MTDATAKTSEFDNYVELRRRNRTVVEGCLSRRGENRLRTVPQDPRISRRSTRLVGPELVGERL